MAIGHPVDSASSSSFQPLTSTVANAAHYEIFLYKTNEELNNPMLAMRQRVTNDYKARSYIQQYATSNASAVKIGRDTFYSFANAA
ncbi:hypothetical protein V1519DRAFT_433018, partial [Lipomyces tetrasporus]